MYDFEKIGKRIEKERGLIERERYEELAKRKKKKGVSLDELAYIVGSTRQTLSKLEKGEKVETDYYLWLQLCNAFECELGYLLCEYDTKTRTAADIQELTGLSETAINNLIRLNLRSKTNCTIFEDGLLSFVSTLLTNAGKTPSVDLYEFISVLGIYRVSKQQGRNDASEWAFKVQYALFQFLNITIENSWTGVKRVFSEAELTDFGLFTQGQAEIDFAEEERKK